MIDVPSLPGIDGQVDALTEAQLRSEEAQKLYEARWGDAAWMDDYWQLRAEGWTWRQAAYMVWASLPKEQRQPKTQGELARRELGLSSDRAIRKWKQDNPAIELRIRELTVSALAKARVEIYAALIQAASNPNPRCHADRKLALEMMGDYVPKQKVTVGAELPDDLAELDVETLRAMAQGTWMEQKERDHDEAQGDA